MTWLNTSVQSGFARSASEAMFPRLFPDVCWLCPSLNPGFGGTRLWDLSGKQNWGTLTNMDPPTDWVTSGGKGALDIQENQYVNMGLVPALDGFRTSFSAFAWVNIQTYWSTDFGIVGKITTGASSLTGWMIWCQGGPIIAYWAGGVRVTGATNLTFNSWQHVGIMYERGVGSVVLNGRIDATATVATAPDTTGCDLEIGRYKTVNDRSMRGRVDDIRIYNRALTATEVRQLYQIGRGNMPLRRRRRYTEQAAGFKAYWANRQHLIGSGVY